MVYALYEQATGLFLLDVPLAPRWVGYSGHGIGLNAPGLQSVRNTGPIPQGLWRVSKPFMHERLGPLCFRLDAVTGTQTYGRSGFFIHGDNKAADRSASHGCIILPRQARERIAAVGCTTLHVQPHLSVQGAKIAA